MKKIDDIVGLPIIDLSSGNQLGRVWDIIIDGDKGSVEFFIIDDGMIIMGAKVVQAKDVQGIGGDALTVAKKEAVTEIAKTDSAVELFKKNVKVKGTKVLTQKGRLVGQAGNLYIDPDNCLISAVEFMFSENIEKVMLIRRDKILTFGESLIVVVENIENMVEPLPDKKIELQTPDDTAKPLRKAELPQKKKANSKSDRVDLKDENLKESGQMSFTEFNDNNEEAESKPLKTTIKSKNSPTSAKIPKQKDKTAREETSLEDITKKETKPPAEVEKSENSDKAPKKETIDTAVKETKTEAFREGVNAQAYLYKQLDRQAKENKQASYREQKPAKPSNLFEERQKEFLIGRQITKTIKSRQGNIILNQGDTITREAVNIAKDEGKLIEMVMNNKP